MTKSRVRFGEKGRAGVEYVGDLPYEHRGECTGVNYVWNDRRPSVWVDKRDLPALVKAAGRENLSSDDIEAKRAPVQKKAVKSKSEGGNDGQL